jgi:hypothetical protein
LSLRSNPGLQLANAFGVELDKLANAFGVELDKLANAFGVELDKLANAFGVELEVANAFGVGKVSFTWL